MSGRRLLLWYVRNPRNSIASRRRLPYFLVRMQQEDQNLDDVAASERARQRAKRVQKTHAKKTKE
jgi:hypothetical protein